MGKGLTNLRLIGVHDSGEHLLLSDGEGTRYLLPLDESLKAAARRDRPRLGQLQIEIDGAIRPREVQALLRTGLTPEEIGDRTGWSVERIRRYEGPVLAEREYAVNLAQQVYVRGGSSPLTLGTRVDRRLDNRGVDPEKTVWDAVRSEEGNWTVSATFAAGGRERVATWFFDMAGRTVVAANDEARWLSEEDTPNGPIPAPHSPQSAEHSVTVFDVEADGGVSPPRKLPPPIDLVQAIREGS
ncbi:MAG: septation protein SepH, partial [Actinomycetia bacterium]|nr:septation protein SepH [Actinomycetes bacterium]